jgi:carboxylate-amine ligase
VEGVRNILRDGTSAHRQRCAYAAAIAGGADAKGALAAIVDDLIAGTVAGL